MKLKKIMKYLPYVLLVIILLTQLITYTSNTSELEAIPGCLYGCYVTMMNGHLLDVIQKPENLWENSGLSYESFPNIFLKGNAYVQAGIYWLFKEPLNLDLYTAWKATIIYSAFLLLLLSIGVFFTARSITKNSYLALIIMFLLNAATIHTIFNHRSIIPQLSFILTYFIYYFVTKYSFEKKNYLFAGGIILLLIITFNYYVLYIFGILFWALSFMLIHNSKILHKSKKLKRFIKDDVNKWMIAIFAIAGILTLLSPWWYHVLIDGPGTNYATSLKLNDDPDFTITKVFFTELITPIKKLIGFSNIKNSILSIMSFGGAFLLLYAFYKKILFKKKQVKLKYEYILSFFLAFFLSSYHYVITVPLTGQELSPHKLIAFFALGTLILLSWIAFSWIAERNMFSKTKKIYTQIAALVIIIILAYTAITSQIAALNTDQFTAAKNADSQVNRMVLKSLYYDYFDKNNILPSDAIVLSTNEISSALNSLIGTEQITGRYGFYYQYIDYQPYWFDAAVMLYSNNSENRKNTLLKYSKKGELYLYWDFFWVNSEFKFDNKGNMQYYYNPLKFYDPIYKELLTKNNISYFENRQSFEPNTYGDKQYRNFNLAIVSPANYRSQMQPWKEDLNQYLTPVWTYEHQGQTIAVLYKIKI